MNNKACSMTKKVFLFCMIYSIAISQAQTFKSKEDRLSWWQDARFGMFIHWGPISLKGKEISWSRGGEIPTNVYDSLYKEFNPVNFNADEWVSLAKAAGMKYIVLTTKHHDGFCLWDTKQTYYNIMHTPFKRDVVKELSEACKRQGMAFGAYYSTCDWYNPDFPLTSPGGKTQRATSNLDAYTNYLKRQIAELMLNYGPLATLWFDVPQKFDSIRGQGIIDFAHIIQPDIIINNRTGAKGDYETPEQRVGKMQLNRPWETCMTIGQQWAYKPDEKLKSLKQCLSGLILSAAGNGNFLFNVGPSPLGVMEPEQVSRLKEMGAWLQKNGESIYGTNGGPYLPGRSIASTRKGNDVFIHILNWKGNAISLPAMSAKVLRATLLNGEKVDVKIATSKMTFTVPSILRDTISTIIKLQVDVPAISIPLIDPMDDYIATASNHHAKFTPDLLVDRSKNPLSRWVTDDSIRQAWVEIDLRQKRTIDKVILNEFIDSHIQKFTVEYRNGSDWLKIVDGETIGEEFTAKFKKINTQFIKVNILVSTTPIGLVEVDVHEVENND